MKDITLFKHPRSCPEGHRQISWHLRDREVYCWLCNRGYAMSECARTGAVGSLATETESAVAELSTGAAG